MSDLHRAVEDEINAFQPDRTPPFAALMDRQRSQHRRRKALAVAAPVLVAVLVAPVAWSAVTGGGDSLVQQAGPAPADGAPGASESTRFSLTYDSEAAYNQSESCLALPGTSDVGVNLSLPPVASVTVTGADEIEAFESCVGSLEGVTLSRDAEVIGTGEATRYAITSQDAAALGKHEQATQDCLGLPGVSRVVSDGFVAPDGTVAVAGADENAAFLDCMNQLEGVIVEERPGGPLSSAWPDTDPPPGHNYVPAPFAVETISPDRRSITVRVAGIAGGCTGQAYGRAVETAEGVKVETVIDVPLDDNVGCAMNLPTPSVVIALSRPLGADEIVLGQCEPNEETPEGRTCSAISPAG